MNHPNGTFFHLIGWKTVIERTFGHKSYYLIAESNGDTAASQHRDRSIERHNNIALQQLNKPGINPRNSINSSNPSNSNNPSNPIVGILPLFSVKSFLFCKSLVSLPFAAYGGILADSQEVTNQLFDKAKDITCSEGLDYLELRNRDGEIENLPSKELYVFFQRKIFDD
ncbi:MAG: hypothetical protein ACXWRE_15180, partial [Pseudobdellovibrionaceae bacterium]